MVESWRGRCLGGGGSVCGARAWTGEMNDARGRRKSASGRWLLSKGRRGTAERGGGSGSGDAMWCGGRMGPGFNRRAASRPRPGQPWPGRGAPLFRQWHADVADARAPAVGERGSEKREARACMGRPGETRSGTSPG
jgi:hypothetical protein